MVYTMQCKYCNELIVVEASAIKDVGKFIHDD